MKALQIESFGNAAEVVKAVDIPDVGKPAAGEVVMALEGSPINQYDLLMIAGSYGYRPRLPAIMGTEGVGRVVSAGAGAVSASYLGGADQNRHTLVAAIAAGRHQPVRNDGRQPADRLLPPNRHCEIGARILGHPECRQFRRRAGNSRDRENAWTENGQCRPS